MLEAHVDSSAKVVCLLPGRQFEVEDKQPFKRLGFTGPAGIDADLASPLQTQRHARQLIGRSRHLPLDLGRDRVADPIDRPDLHPARRLPDQVALRLRHDHPHSGRSGVRHVGQNIPALRISTLGVLRVLHHEMTVRGTQQPELGLPLVRQVQRLGNLYFLLVDEVGLDSLRQDCGVVARLELGKLGLKHSSACSKFRIFGLDQNFAAPNPLVRLGQHLAHEPVHVRAHLGLLRRPDDPLGTRRRGRRQPEQDRQDGQYDRCGGKQSALPLAFQLRAVKQVTYFLGERQRKHGRKGPQCEHYADHEELACHQQGN